MVRLILLGYFLLMVISGSAQPQRLRHADFAARYLYLDSLVGSFGDHDYGEELLKMEKSSIANRDKDLAMMTRLFLLKSRWRKDVRAVGVEQALDEVLDYARANRKKQIEAVALQFKGELFSESGRSVHGFESYLSAYVIYSAYSVYEFPPKERFLFTLGSAYYSYGDNENALKYVKEAISVPNFVLQKSHTEYNTIGLIYRNIGKYDTAEWYFQRIIDTATANRDSVWVNIAMGNIGITYFYEKKFREAIPLLRQDIELSIRHHVLKNAVGSILILGSLYYQQNELDKAKEVLEQGLAICHSKQFWYDYALQERMYSMVFKVYAARKEPVLATLYADSAMMAKDSNLVKNNALMYAKKQEKLELMQRNVANRQLENQKKVNFFLALVSLLLLIIGILTYLNQRMTARLNKQIISQKKELERLNDVKDRILSVISHDMRTPVNSLIAFTELLERGNISEDKMKAYTGTLKTNLGYTVRLMENLLNWARTQMQGYKPVLETFDMAFVAGQAVELLQNEADKKGVLIRNEIRPDSLVYADMNMTSLLLRNLLNNAIKYTRSGGCVELSAVKAEADLQLIVKDNGVGIPALQVEEFNSSVRQSLDSTPGTNNEKGTGLGLMLCKNFAALMNGKIVLESQEGKGSKFTLELPAAG